MIPSKLAIATIGGSGAGVGSLGRLEEAVAIAKDVTCERPDVTWVHRLLASWAARAGDIETVHSAARSLLATHSEFAIRCQLEIPALQDMPEDRDQLAQGLQDAGLLED